MHKLYFINLPKMCAGKTQLVNPDLNAKENAWKNTLRFIEFVLIKLSGSVEWNKIRYQNEGNTISQNFFMDKFGMKITK